MCAGWARSRCRRTRRPAGRTCRSRSRLPPTLLRLADRRAQDIGRGQPPAHRRPELGPAAELSGSSTRCARKPGQDPGGRAPDRLVGQLVEVDVEIVAPRVPALLAVTPRRPSAPTAAPRRPATTSRDRASSTGRPVEQADERRDREPRRHGRDAFEPGDDLDRRPGRGRSPRAPRAAPWPAGRVERGIVLAARERDLALMRRHRLGPLREDHRARRRRASNNGTSTAAGHAPGLTAARPRAPGGSERQAGADVVEREAAGRADRRAPRARAGPAGTTADGECAAVRRGGGMRPRYRGCQTAGLDDDRPGANAWTGTSRRLWESVADALPDRVAIVQGERRRTWTEFDDRAARLAAALVAAGPRAGRQGRVRTSTTATSTWRALFATFKMRGVAGQRELPVPRGRARLPPRQLRRRGAALPRRASATASPRCATGPRS